MLVVDGLSGRLRNVVMLPPEGRTDLRPLVLEDRIVVAALDRKGTRHLSAHLIESGELAWTLTLPGGGGVCGLEADEERIVVLQSDGHLGTYDAEDGTPLTLTRIFVGEQTGRRADARPHHDTAIVVLEDRIVLMPRVVKPPTTVGAWSRRTGKLVWHTRFEDKHRPSRSALLATDDFVLTLTPSSPRRGPSRVRLRVLDLSDGTVRQEIEPLGLTAEFALLSMAAGWNSVVVFGRAGAMLYSAAKPAGAKDR
jgi:outer membrane protein assembly factor BamB